MGFRHKGFCRFAWSWYSKTHSKMGGYITYIAVCPGETTGEFCTILIRRRFFRDSDSLTILQKWESKYESRVGTWNGIQENRVKWKIRSNPRQLVSGWIPTPHFIAVFKKGLGHIASHAAIFRAERTISGSGGRTTIILSVLEYSRRVYMRSTLKYTIWLNFSGIWKWGSWICRTWTSETCFRYWRRSIQYTPDARE